MYELVEYRADEFMTFPVVTIGAEASLRDALAVFDELDFNCIPVTENGRLLGVLSKLDVLKAFSSNHGRSYQQILDADVAGVMNRAPHTVSGEALLSDVMKLMIDTGFKSFPVIRGGELVGIISRVDVVRAIECAAAGRGGDAARRDAKTHPKLGLLRDVAQHLGCGAKQAEGMTSAVFRELRDRLTPKESAHVAAQLSDPLRRLWLEEEHADRSVRRIHKEEFLGRVRRRAGLADDGEAEKVVRVVFRALQRTLGSATGKEGESWDVFSQLPKDLKVLWLETGAHTVPAKPLRS